MAIIDFHAHILPGADHGSGSVETSKRQLTLMREAGVSAVVATPHFYPHQQSSKSFLERRAASAAELQGVLLEADPIICLGAEVLVCPGMENMEGLEDLTVEGTNVLLLEMPMSQWSTELLDTIEAIGKRGFRTVMAHIDRYPMEWVQKLLARGPAAQLNPMAFSSMLGGQKYLPYIADGTVVALGSDLHGGDPSGYKPFLKMLKRLGDTADAIFAQTEALLQGASLM